jgi:hypothetical protein
VKNSLLAQAVTNRKIIRFWYNGLMRTAEPHTYGIHVSTGNEVLSAYQTGGFGHSGELPGWRLFSLDEIRDIVADEGIFKFTRPGYNPIDSRMSHIFARA